MVALRIELSATQLSAGFGQPALDYRSDQSSIGMAGIEPTRSCTKARGLATAQHPVVLFSMTRVGFEPNLFSLKD